MAHYDGTPVVELLKDGRNVKLKSDLTFYDTQGTRWSVPAEAVVDGASIPPLLWSLVGSPLTGKFRDASIIHDWYCDRRTRTWQATHRMFYEAMVASGVSQLQAKAMYFGVRWRGPRWAERVTLNANLRVGEEYNFNAHERLIVCCESPGLAVDEEKARAIFESILGRIENEDLSLTALDALADHANPSL